MRYRSQSRRLRALALAGLGIAFVGVVSIATALRPSAANETTFCDVKAPGPVSAVVLETSDPLAPKSRAMIEAMVHDAITGRRGARLVIARVDGAREYRPDILFNDCDPGTAEEATVMEGRAARDALRQDRFLAPIDKAITKLAAAAPAGRRPYLADTLMHVVADPAMHLVGPSVWLTFLSDLIENTDSSKPYVTRRVTLPVLQEPVFADIDMHVLELPALADAANLQTVELAETWRGWLMQGSPRSLSVQAPGVEEHRIALRASH